MINKLINSAGALTSGGTIGGDLTVEGGLVVEGDTSLTVDAAITGDVKIVKDDDCILYIDSHHDTDTKTSEIRFRKTDNTAASPHEVVENENLGTLSFWGYNADATGYNQAAKISSQVDGEPSSSSDDSDMPGRLMFFTTPNAASTPVEQLRIGKGGNVGIKAAARLYFDGVAGTGHTYIDEESNDLLRIAVGATEVMKLDPNSQISLSNNDLGTANTIYGKKAGEDLASGGNYNVLLGEMAGENVSTGVSNVAIGYSALKTSSANGDKNVAIGYLALEDMQADTDGDGQNVAVGFECAKNLSTGTENTALGTLAMGSGVVTGNDNTAIGYGSGDALTGGAGNVILGAYAGGAIANVNNTVLIGKEAGDAVNNTGANGIVAIGWNAGKAITAAPGCTFVGYNSGAQEATGNRSTVLGYGAMDQSGNAASSDAAMQNDDNTFIGWSAGGGDWTTAASSENTGVGSLALGGAMNGSNYNTAVGKSALGAITQGDNNTAIGWGAADALTVESKCVAIGSASLSAANSADANGTVAIGYQAMEAMTSGQRNVAIGYQALKGNVEGDDNTAVGYGALDQTVTSESNLNTAIGKSAMGGDFAGESNRNVAIGPNTLAGALNDANDNIAIGNNSLLVNVSGDNNIAIGSSTLVEHTTGGNNIAIGQDAMNQTAGSNASTSSDNIAIGYNTLGGDWADAVSDKNVAIGNGAMAADLEGANNNVAIGYDAGNDITQGDNNTCIGHQAGDALTTGSYNTVIGATSEISAVGGQNQIVIGYTATGQGNNTATLGNGDITDVYMAEDKGAAVHCAKVNSIVATGGGAGNGFDTISPTISVGNYNSEIVTTVFLDIGAGGILSSNTAGDAIGENDTADAYFTRITTAINGLVYRGEMICLEAPTTGDDDINLVAHQSQIAEDADVETGGHVLINGGTWTKGLRKEFDASAMASGVGLINDYIYLSHGGTTAGTYDAGKFLIKFYGASESGL